jgi:MerR family transcriptional regulator/heat shock protein HspR
MASESTRPASRQSSEPVPDRRFQQDPGRPCFVISVAASLVHAHPRTLRIYEDEGLLAPARTPTNIRLYSENDIRRILWIRRLTQERGINLAGVRLLFELEERLGKRLLEALFDEAQAREAASALAALPEEHDVSTNHRAAESASEEPEPDFSDESRSAGRSGQSISPARPPITRIVATRVTTRDREATTSDREAIATRSGDSNE